MSINFRELENRGGLPGAREEFERVIVHLAYGRHGAMAVLARLGDWGIDAFVGNLDGEISVWQAKYFPDAIEDEQKAQIRDSFKSAVEAGERHGHKITAWTLCIPTEFDAPTHRWWQRWKAKKERETGVLIDLWPRTVIEGMLLSPEAAHIAAHYFPQSAGTAGASAVAKVLPLPGDLSYQDNLFIRQLEEAGIVENESAKREFFNHEALAREVGDKADPVERQTLENVRAEVHSIWEARFAAASPDPGTGRDPNLHSTVMGGIRDQYKDNPPRMPPMNLVHQKGAMHDIVDNGDAGWVAHFREIAEAHSVAE